MSKKEGLQRAEGKEERKMGGPRQKEENNEKELKKNSPFSGKGVSRRIERKALDERI